MIPQSRVLTTILVEQLCPKHRGGTFDIQSSTTWESLGDWQLSFPYTDVEANGNYGLDTLVVRDSLTEGLVSLDEAVIATFNSTEYYSGFLGLGIISGEFNGHVSDSPFSQMVAEFGWFSSYTYGYTAGAYYSTDCPVSPVLMPPLPLTAARMLIRSQRDPEHRRR